MPSELITYRADVMTLSVSEHTTAGSRGIGDPAGILDGGSLQRRASVSRLGLPELGYITCRKTFIPSLAPSTALDQLPDATTFAVAAPPTHLSQCLFTSSSVSPSTTRNMYVFASQNCMTATNLPVTDSNTSENSSGSLQLML